MGSPRWLGTGAAAPARPSANTATWHRVAPLLADSWRVVCPDLRGYGQSSKPPTTADHEPYSKRAMARDCAALMRALGHHRYSVVGHDRVRLRRTTACARRRRRRDTPRLPRRRANRRSARPGRHALHPGMVALVLSGPDREACRTHHLGRPRRVVQARRRHHGRRGVRRCADGAARPGSRPRDVRGLPGGAGYRPRAR